MDFLNILKLTYINVKITKLYLRPNVQYLTNYQDHLKFMTLDITMDLIKVRTVKVIGERVQEVGMTYQGIKLDIYRNSFRGNHGH